MMEILHYILFINSKRISVANKNNAHFNIKTISITSVSMQHAIYPKILLVFINLYIENCVSDIVFYNIIVHILAKLKPTNPFIHLYIHIASTENGITAVSTNNSKRSIEGTVRLVQKATAMKLKNMPIRILHFYLHLKPLSKFSDNII
jgi:hypothetical protein